MSETPEETDAAEPVQLPKRPTNDPLHGVTLEALLTVLVSVYGWDGMADRVRVNCFIDNPSIKSSLKFLRKTPWARTKVEALYVAHIKNN